MKPTYEQIQTARIDISYRVQDLARSIDVVANVNNEEAYNHIKKALSELRHAKNLLTIQEAVNR
jgi:hypothetical protein